MGPFSSSGRSQGLLGPLLRHCYFLHKGHTQKLENANLIYNFAILANFGVFFQGTLGMNGLNMHYNLDTLFKK